MGRNIVYYGYHGTSLEKAQDILRSKRFIESENDGTVFQCLKTRAKHYHWLGRGVYFWDNDIEIARYWGKKRYKKRKFSVLGVPIECDKDRVLDLRQNSKRKSMEDLINLMIIPYLDFDFNEYSTNEKNTCIGYVCDVLCERNMYDVCYNDFEIDSNQDLLYTKVTPQICVKNKNVIKYDELELVD